MPNLMSKKYYRYDEYFKDVKGKIAQLPGKVLGKRFTNVPEYKEPEPAKRRWNNKVQTLIESIMQEFESGKTFVELITDKPFLFRKSLHSCIKRRELLWTFATTEDSVFVIRK